MTEAWIGFETAVGRGSGHLRLRDGKAWTLLTTLYELRGFEEPKGPGRPRGVEHGAERDRLSWLERRGAGGRGARLLRAALRRHRGWRAGRDRPRSATAPTRRADDHRRAQRAARRLLAQALQVALPARPGLVRPPAVHQVPRELAGVLAEGQDRRLARDVHEGHGAQLLGLLDGPVGLVRRGGVGGGRRSRRARRSCCGRSSSCWRRGCPRSRTSRRSRGWTSSRATSTTPRSIRARTPTWASGSWSSAPTTPLTTSARRSGRPASTSRWCSAPRPTSCGRAR